MDTSVRILPLPIPVGIPVPQHYQYGRHYDAPPVYYGKSGYGGFGGGYGGGYGGGVPPFTRGLFGGFGGPFSEILRNVATSGNSRSGDEDAQFSGTRVKPHDFSNLGNI